jgi:hypothetical protein
MGAGEFEFGALPDAMNIIASAFVTGQECMGSIIIKKHTIFYICAKEHETDVIQRIRDLAANKVRLKERSGLNESIDDKLRIRYGETEPRPIQYIGWLELDNGFMFFIDKGVFEKTVTFFREWIMKAKGGST